MEIFRAVESVLGKLCYVINEDKKLTRTLKNDLTCIKGEMEMVNACIKVAEDEGNFHDPLEEQWILQLQKLAYDIEDSIDTLYQSPKVFFIRRGVSMLTGTDHRPESIDALKSLKERVGNLRDWKSNVATTSSTPSGSPCCTSGTALGNQLLQNCCTAGNNHVGIDGPKKEVMDLLLRPQAAADGEAEQLRVVCIVGFAGLGKSTLAKAVFDSLDVYERGRRDVDELPLLCRAWVEASKHSHARELLEDIHRQVGGCTSETSLISTLAQLGERLRTYLHSKRYFIVIDDIQKKELWENIKCAFPKKNTSTSSIVVTTRRQSVAKACSYGSYIYKMQPLGRDRSKDLLWQSVDNSCPQPPPALGPGLDGIIDKCDGLPLALLSTARFLRGLPGDLDGGKCKLVAHALGDYLAKKDAFADTRRVLAQCYESLPDYGHKTCLLYVSIFPKGHLIKRHSLFRRWSAEGFVVGEGLLTEEDVARDRFDELIDRSFIEPEMVNNSGVIGYRVQGVMLEFIVQRTTFENFVSLIHNGKLIHDGAGSVRRLSVQHSTKDSARRAMESIEEQSHIRSLTIAGSDLIDFQRCEVLRVLDLANCRGLTDDVLGNICDLLLLKYLSLRGSSDVRNIPKDITKLKLLETLDIRETEVKTLHIEVITLPSLLHLFGEFQLDGDARFTSHLFGKFRLHGEHGGARFTSQLHGDARFTSSKLQTLSGLIMDEQGSFAYIINQMRFLRKVKILWKSSPSANPSRLFEGGIDLEHLSIDCGNLSIDFLNCLTAPSNLSSIKLRGKLTRLPNFLTSIEFLSKLHLFSTGLSCEVLSGLQSLPCLEYLKLVEENRVFGDGIFLVRSGGFPSLLRLCFEAPKLPLVQITEQGTMTNLTSLHLLCPEFADELGVMGIQHLQRLNEVILHPSIGDSKLEAWKREAIQHKNSPYVKKQPINDAEQLMEQ